MAKGTSAVVAIACLAFALLAGCSPDEQSSTPPAPIVVLSVSALPAGLVGALGGEQGWTPNIDALAAEERCERAVAPSSSPIPAMATLLTGVDAWAHQLVSHRSKALRADLATVPEVLGPSWTRHGFFPLGQRYQDFGLLKGFDSLHGLASDAAFPGPELEGVLSQLAGSSFVWVHLPDPSFPWTDRTAQLPHLGPREGSFEEIQRRWLMPFADPNQEIPEPLLSETRELLRHQVAWADERLGRLLAVLRRSPEWPRMRLLVTALHGLELGEHRQVLFAQNLERSSLEVPLCIKSDPVPRDLFLASISRMAATMVGWAGLQPAPAMSPSLFLGQEPALSSLFDHGGVNRLSLVRSDEATNEIRQVLWSRRYAPEEPEMWAAAAVEAGLGSQPIRESPRAVLERIRQPFRDVAPRRAGGGLPPEIRLVRWHRDGRTEEVESAATESAMASQLMRTWRLFHDTQRTPREAQRYWSTKRR